MSTWVSSVCSIKNSSSTEVIRDENELCYVIDKYLGPDCVSVFKDIIDSFKAEIQLLKEEVNEKDNKYTNDWD